MLRPVLLGGQLVEPLPDLNAARARPPSRSRNCPPRCAVWNLAEPWPVRHSKDLVALIERTRRNLLQA